MHPFARARERTRALNAAKMERMFAKPFVASLEGHVDAVETMARKPDTLDIVASGSWDGGAFHFTVIWIRTWIGYVHLRCEHGLAGGGFGHNCGTYWTPDAEELRISM